MVLVELLRENQGARRWTSVRARQSLSGWLPTGSGWPQDSLISEPVSQAVK